MAQSGPFGFSLPPRPARSPEFRARARALYDTGLSVAAVARAMGVTKNVISGISWRDDWPGRGSPIHPREDADAFDRQVLALRDEALLSWRQIGARLGCAEHKPRHRYYRVKKLEERKRREAAE